MKTKFHTFYIRPLGQTIICLQMNFESREDGKYYQYTWMNKLTGIARVDYIREELVDDFFKDFVLLEDYFLSLHFNS